MGFKLLAPGTRNGNKFYYARIRVNKRTREVSTGTTNKKLATEFAKRAEETFFRHESGERTLVEMIDNYLHFRRPGAAYERDCLRLKDLLGHRTEIGQQDFDEAARILYPGCSNATWNRHVYTPLQATLRHNGVNLLIKRPRIPRPTHKALTASQRDLLLANAEDPEFHALLTLLFYAGPRIGEALKLTWDRVDLTNAMACFEMSKVEDDHWRPLHPKVIEVLANLPKGRVKVFRFKDRGSIRCHIRKMNKKTGVYFHPHMARHTFADLLMGGGASLRDLMDAGGWKNQKSAMRYTARNVERVRKAIGSL